MPRAFPRRCSVDQSVAARFTAAQVLEHIFSSVDHEDYSDSEEEEVPEDKDGAECNPEREASSHSSE